MVNCYGMVFPVCRYDMLHTDGKGHAAVPALLACNVDVNARPRFQVSDYAHPKKGPKNNFFCAHLRVVGRAITLQTSKVQVIFLASMVLAADSFGPEHRLLLNSFGPPTNIYLSPKSRCEAMFKWAFVGTLR